MNYLLCEVYFKKFLAFESRITLRSGGFDENIKIKLQLDFISNIELKN